jgi:hypothetical protein
MHRKIAVAALVAVTSLTSVMPAEAQRRGGQPSLTLFTGVDYREQSIVITRDVADLRTLNFDDAAGSLIARGDWQVCLDPNFTSRCRTYSDSIPNLASFRGRISSVRYLGGGPGGDDRGRNDYSSRPYVGQAVSGRSTIFYPGQVSSSFDRSPQAADNFCRSQGNGLAVYFSQDRNGNLEDVLCRR